MVTLVYLMIKISSWKVTSKYIDEIVIGKNCQDTRGFRGPWIAHLRNRSNVTMESLYRGWCCKPNIKALGLVQVDFLRCPYVTLYKFDKPPGRAHYNPRSSILTISIKDH